jgi:hypothetical protein
VVPLIKRRQSVVLCVSCRMRPALSIQYGSSRCVPWRGDFDLDDNPMIHGNYLLPGERLCGHKDCVNPHHIELDDVLDSE